MEDGKRKPDAEASSSTISNRQRPWDERKSGSPRPDSPEKINELSESGVNSGPSASHTSLIGNNYYIFLSFRGIDTRKGFVDHLYHKLVDTGLHHPDFVFRDDEKLCFGKPIDENLLSAIERSKVSIPIISENYAASEWCLREIIQIMECVESGKQKVYPVLYKVTPSDVREMGGKFGSAFRWRKHTFDKEVKRKGPEMLKKALDNRIFESEKMFSGHEGKLVKELVQVIMGELQHDFLPPLPRNLVGIDNRVAEVMKLVDTNPSKTQIIGICGIGGIGKTALATTIYNKLSNKFKCRSILMDIRETINRKGMEHIQHLLMLNITNNKKSRVPDPVTGRRNTQFSCKDKKVLILLDDVSHRDQLDILIGECNFESGSRIIITCRDKAILKSEYDFYEVKKLDSKDSMLLFSSYAFEPEQPQIELATVRENIVATTGGLPLALKIIGLFLNGKDESIWTETLQKLRKVPNIDVQQKLRISYDSLEYEQQQMFLDIACFFIGTKKEIAAYLWKDLQYCPDTGLERMIELSLMEIDDNDELRMHDQLRDLGKAIACPAKKKPWKCSRLWDEKAIIVQRSKFCTASVLLTTLQVEDPSVTQEENRNIEALRLDKNGSIKFMERESYRRMPYLNFLHLSEVGFVGDFGDSLSELRWLEWEMCPGSFNATSIYLEKLQVLDLSGGFISENWEGWNSIKMERLKVLNLSRCLNLQSTPNLSAFKNLELLILQECANLKEIDHSIGDVKCLISLNLRYCKSLEKLPEQLGKLGELVELDLSWTGIKKLPEFIEDLNKLKILGINGSQIERLPSSIGKLQSLQELDANSCFHLEGQILVDKGGLSSLKTLDLHNTKISGLPENLDQLSSLEHLDLSECKELESLPKPPCSLSYLGLTCRSKELPSLSHLKHLQELYLVECKSLQSIPELPSCIQKLAIWSCPKLERLLKLSDLKFLSKLWLMECDGLKKLDGLEALKSLRELDLSLDSNQKPDDLHVIKGLEKLGFLEVVDISARICIQVLDLSKSEHLKWLNVKDCKSLLEIRCPSKSLEYFNRDGCESLKKLPEFLPHDGLWLDRRKRDSGHVG